MCQLLHNLFLSFPYKKKNLNLKFKIQRIGKENFMSDNNATNPFVISFGIFFHVLHIKFKFKFINLNLFK